MATTPPTQNAPRASLLRLAYGSAPQRRSRTTSGIITNQQTRHRGGATSSVEPGATASGDTQERFGVEGVERITDLGPHPPTPPTNGLESQPPENASCPEGVVLAFGEPAWGIEGWRSTHRQAQTALAVALRRRDRIPPTRVTRYADVALLAAALKDEALARALVGIYIAPLEDSRGGGPVLCETLRVYLACERNVSSAAAALKVARKTVDTRLRTIEKRLGRTLHPCPAELEVALALDELTPVPGPVQSTYSDVSPVQHGQTGEAV